MLKSSTSVTLLNFFLFCIGLIVVEGGTTLFIRPFGIDHYGSNGPFIIKNLPKHGWFKNDLLDHIFIARNPEVIEKTITNVDQNAINIDDGLIESVEKPKKIVNQEHYIDIRKKRSPVDSFSSHGYQATNPNSQFFHTGFQGTDSFADGNTKGWSFANGFMTGGSFRWTSNDKRDRKEVDIIPEEGDEDSELIPQPDVN